MPDTERITLQILVEIEVPGVDYDRIEEPGYYIEAVTKQHHVVNSVGATLADLINASGLATDVPTYEQYFEPEPPYSLYEALYDDEEDDSD